MMVGSRWKDYRIFSLLRKRTVKKRTIIFGLNSDNCSREILLRLLTIIVKPEDNVLAVHVQEQNDTFDPNAFHIHEDICKNKKVDFLVKVCMGGNYISELCQEVRVNHATILALGCKISWPKESVVNTCLKGLPPTCTLLVMDNRGRVLIQRQGTSQQGTTRVIFKSSFSSLSRYNYFDQEMSSPKLKKSFTMPPSPTSSTLPQSDTARQCSVRKKGESADLLEQRVFWKSKLQETAGTKRHFTFQDLNSATNNFSPEFLIGQNGNSKVYKASLENGQAAAVKVLKTTHWSAEAILQEVEILFGVKHDNIVQIIGYCISKEIHAIVYNLVKGSLTQSLKQLKWSERMGIATGVAKALEYLHHSCNPPIIHRDVKSSNIFLSDNGQPRLTDFGAAILHYQSEKISNNKKPPRVVGSFGYLAPEYMMYGMIDEKVDVYSYGVVLLELITGKEAIQSNHPNHETLVLRARSFLSCGLCERLVDPNLSEDYNKEEMEILMFAARLCLVHSSSRRPTMKMIVRLFEEPEHWKKMKKERDELLNKIGSKTQTDIW